MPELRAMRNVYEDAFTYVAEHPGAERRVIAQHLHLSVTAADIILGNLRAHGRLIRERSRA